MGSFLKDKSWCALPKCHHITFEYLDNIISTYKYRILDEQLIIMETNLAYMPHLYTSQGSQKRPMNIGLSILFIKNLITPFEGETFKNNHYPTINVISHTRWFV